MESSGPPESRYERYSQLVSQKEGDSQSRETLATPSPEKTKMPATVLETPMRQKPSLCPSPLIHGITAAAMTGKEDSQEWYVDAKVTPSAQISPSLPINVESSALTAFYATLIVQLIVKNTRTNTEQTIGRQYRRSVA